MRTMNQAEFAKLHDVSRKTVTTWKARGWLVFAGEQVDVDASNELLAKYRRDGIDASAKPVTQAAKGSKKGNKQGNKPGNTKGNSAERPKRRDPEPPPAREDGEPDVPSYDEFVASGNANMPFDEARRVKENYLALLNRLEYEQKSGSLVDIELARSILFEEFRAQRDAWLNWPTRVGPLLAADFGMEADKVTEALTEHVHKQISSLGEPEGDFNPG